MNLQNTAAGPLGIALTAHEGPEGRILLVEAQCIQQETRRSPLELAIVIDRSGSMQGRKLEIARNATAEFVRTLAPQDRVSIVTYDDHVEVLCPLSPPSDGLARLIERIHAGGSTNLYGGWVKGAKLLSPGARVLLLSDGLANHGRFQSAFDLARHAGISYEKFRITTSTIGVGEDYDEALMAGMARTGGGTHYFAFTAESIREAFSQERFSVGAVAVGFVTVVVDGKEVQFGHFWAGETKRVAIELRDLPREAEVRWMHSGTTRVDRAHLDLPNAFGQSDRATFQLLLDRTIALEADAVTVRNRESASALRERLRGLLLSMLNHPMADHDEARSAIARIEASCDRLEGLSRVYDERDATMHRKRSMQSSYNLRERAKSFSSFADEAPHVMQESRAMRAPAPLHMALDEARLARASMDQWRGWEAVPILASKPTVAMVNARDGFTIAEIEQALGEQVESVPLAGGTAELEDLIAAYRP